MKIMNTLLLGDFCSSTKRGVIKHKTLGYHLFKEGYVKKVKPRVLAERFTFLIKCFVVASMKKHKYVIYVHLCQKKWRNTV